MRRAAFLLGILVASCDCSFALNPSLDISQYAHAAWAARDGFSLGNIYAMAQTPDGYLWLGGEFGLFRFDGVRSIPWQPPAGQHLPDKPFSLLVTRDGTLWIGTYAGLVTWSGGKLRRRWRGKKQKGKRAVEMPGLWKEWKAKTGLSTLSTSPLEISPKAGEIPTFPQLRRRGRMEKWKTKSRFPTFPPPRFVSLKTKTGAGGLRPARSAPRRLKSSCR